MIRDKAGNKFVSQEDMRDFYKEYDNTIKEFMIVRENVMRESKDGEDISDIVDLGGSYAYQMASNGHVNKPMDFLRLMKYMIEKYKRYSHADTRKQNSDIRKDLFAKNSRKLTTHAKMPVMDIWDADTQSVERDEQRDRKKKKSSNPKSKRKPVKKVVKKCKCKY